jgi:hypothetical protein
MGHSVAGDAGQASLQPIVPAVAFRLIQSGVMPINQGARLCDFGCAVCKGV